jgi:hypothetical protein
MIVSLFNFLKESPDVVFWASALFGTTLFFMRLCVTMLGGLSDEWADGDDLAMDDSDGMHHQTGSFKLFTLHSLSGFFMMFGWVGLACTKQLEYSQQASMVYGLLAGSVTMMLTALIFKWSRMLVSTGTRFNIEKTINLVGTVYQRISGNEPGKIQVVVDGVTRELLALSCDGGDIESFQIVRVVKVLDYETVMVQRV